MREDLGRDLALLFKADVRAVVTPLYTGADLATVDGYENLAQAIWLRLATPRGELAGLGHPTYGSRLERLIGRLISPEVLALAKAYVREALRAEPRIAAIHDLQILPDPGRPGALLIELRVQPVESAAPLDLALSFQVDTGAAEV
jgi:phage baseplate assembly protein W